MITNLFVGDFVFEGTQEITREKFRVANKRLVLVYLCHLEKESYKSWLTQALFLQNGTIPSLLEVAHISRPNSDVPHFSYVALETKKALNTSKPTFFDYKDCDDTVHVAKNVGFERRCVEACRKKTRSGRYRKSIIVKLRVK